MLDVFNRRRTIKTERRVLDHFVGYSKLQPMSVEAQDPNMPADNKMTVVFVLGSPGAGKGTLSKRFADEFGYYHLSVGDYLRELCDLSKEQSQQSLGGLSQHELQASLKTRTLIPASTIVSIVHQKLEQERANRYNSFLIDGFPRSDDAAEAFDREVGSSAGLVGVLKC